MDLSVFFQIANRVIAVIKQFPGLTTLVVALLVASGILVFYMYTHTAPTLPIAVSRVQQVFFSNYAQFPVSNREDDAQAISNGEVTITNTSSDKLVLDLHLNIEGPKISNYRIRADLRGPFNLIYGKNDIASAKSPGILGPLFQSPIELGPKQVERKRLIFLIDMHRELGLLLMSKSQDHTYRLEITDLISGNTISILIPGDYRG